MSAVAEKSEIFVIEPRNFFPNPNFIFVCTSAQSLHWLKFSLFNSLSKSEDRDMVRSLFIHPQALNFLPIYMLAQPHNHMKRLEKCEKGNTFLRVKSFTHFCLSLYIQEFSILTHCYRQTKQRKILNYSELISKIKEKKGKQKVITWEICGKNVESQYSGTRKYGSLKASAPLGGIYTIFSVDTTVTVREALL